MICPRCGSEGTIKSEVSSPFGLHKLGIFPPGLLFRGTCANCSFTGKGTFYIPGEKLTEAQAKEQAERFFINGIEKGSTTPAFAQWAEAEKRENAKVQTNLNITNTKGAGV